ncbi:hypothetical protein NQD34_005931 [Periophthalmus magnuspinnatus]|uniref:uncharacterized protein si:ch73-170d6.2 n=1 Tax=Periophthalmus magnuspinnatus TaxID=409849 RepID=UPI00145A617C|nr:uncharacterized protein si:ch73-170d6.2 [Periophthalmus magnuspinnatus]KAJ0000911.1 hypothetical protein NQD34_005931 [Periophthalmus magnuspinnatus]
MAAPDPKRLCDSIKAQSSRFQSQSWALPVYLLPLVDEQLQVPGCRRFRFGEENTAKPTRTIMMMGATGAGKSTLIDGMINYILGVRWNDDYRFKLVREVQKGTQAVSQTSEVTVYKLNYQDGFQVNYSLTIIDTPGFGDNRGIDRDRQITDQLRALFTSSSGVCDIDAVCFVVQAALARLTHSQKYVFDSVLSIFGKDIASNIRVLVTFADGQRPPVLDAITAAAVPCPIEKGVPLHFKFNNSALSANNKSTKGPDEEQDEEDEFDQMFWNMGSKSMKRFFAALSKIQTKSLTLTKEVLTERKQLENLVENLQKQVRVGLCKLEEIRQTSQMVEQHKAEISRNKNFEFNITVSEPQQVDISGTGIFITNCQQCHYTCHDDCAYANDADKIRCVAMGKDGNCKVCPNNCIWSVHFNQKYKWEYISVTKKETITDLKKKYEIAKDAKNTVEALLREMELEYEDVQVEVAQLIDQSSTCLNRLKQIALKPDPLSAPEYIDMLIKVERSEAKEGWQRRVDSLMAMKEKAEYMARVGRGETFLERPRSQPAKKKGFLSWFR